MRRDTVNDFSGPIRLLDIIRAEWKWWLPLALVSSVLASVFMSGWPAGLVPNLTTPYAYRGDGLFSGWLAQRSLEGWVFENPRTGFPFGSNSLDFPTSDTGSQLIIKLVGAISSTWYSAINIYFLLGFAVTAITTFCVLRSVGLVAVLSAAAALLYNFLPFHIFRIQHIYYTWYFCAPLYFYFALRIFYFHENSERENNISSYSLWNFLVCFVLASFGVYYAFFGCIVIGFAGIAGWMKIGKVFCFKIAIASIMAISFGVLLNLTPAIEHIILQGQDHAVANRQPQESEEYGLKLIQLVLPRPGHRIGVLAKVTQTYSTRFPLVNENSVAALGILGTVGLALCGIIFFSCLSGRYVDSRLSFLTLLVFVLFLFGTIGGLGALFALFISPMIRAWNRISIFIGFGSLAVLFLTFQLIVKRYVKEKFIKITFYYLSLLCICLGLFDQTMQTDCSQLAQSESNFKSDARFFKKVEALLPKGSSIYQLPYMPFPENGPVYHLHDYELFTGFLHSKTLRWSYGGMKGRGGDWFFRALAKEPISLQLDVIKRLGFEGLLIDRRGFPDNAVDLINHFTELLGQPALVHENGEIVFFRILPISKVSVEGLTDEQLMIQAKYYADKNGVRYTGSWTEGLDFTRHGLPNFIKDISGISGWEPWGRWSDGPKVTFVFFKQLPQSFTLVLDGQPFGPNAGKNIILRVGGREYSISILAQRFEIKQLIKLNGALTNRLEFLIPSPTSPLELGNSADPRKLGIGFIRLKIIE